MDATVRRLAKDLLGDYEKRGSTVQGVGKFIAMGLDDPFHVTTVSGFAIYGVGKLMERNTNYGIRMAKMDLQEIKRQLREALLDIHSLRL